MSPVQMGHLAEADLRAALEDIGATVRPAGREERADLVVDVDGSVTLIEVKATAHATAERAALLGRGARDGVAHVLVADTVTSQAKEVLRGRGWGWLDRKRGHLAVRGPGLLVDARVPPIVHDNKTASTARLLAGRAARSWAAALLMDPGAPPSIRDVARRSQMGSATVGEAAKRLKDASLVRADGRPLVPELFWELADAWSGETPVPLAAVPTRAQLDGLLEFRGEHGEIRHLNAVLSGTAAAAVWGASVAAGGSTPPEFYVPGAAASRSLERRLGRAERYENRAASVTNAPTLLVCDHPFSDLNRTPFDVAHPLFVALDLAQDRGRGREILAEFEPPEPFARVW